MEELIKLEWVKFREVKKNGCVVSKEYSLTLDGKAIVEMIFSKLE
jgi:predicted transcriptional regulator